MEISAEMAVLSALMKWQYQKFFLVVSIKEND